MINSFVPPKPGDIIVLMCVNCKKIFSGPNPSDDAPFMFINKKNKRSKCPNCGSKRIIPYPWICY